MNEIVYAGKHTLTMNVARHEHATWELIYCTSGGGTLLFDDCEITYTEGDVVAIPPYIAHTNISATGFTNIFVNLSDSNINYKSPVVIQDDSNRFILSAFNAAFFHYNESEERDLLLKAYGHMLAGYIRTYHRTPVRSDIVEEICTNIVRNFPYCDYELDTYLRSLPFSYDYLRKLFKKEMGVTPHQYLCDKRLDTAADWLSMAQNDGSNIADVSRMCGFREPLYFSRMFKKKFGTAPSFYRSDNRQAVQRLSDDSVKIVDTVPDD